MDLIDTLNILAFRSSGTWDPEGQHALIESLPIRVRDEVVRRLQVLVPLFADSDAGVAAVDVAAASIGVSRRSVYHLLERLKHMPPVDGVAVRGTSLVPRRRNDPREGAKGDVLDDAIRDLLRIRPDARLSEFVIRARSAVEGTGQPPPAAKTVSRRLDALRAACAVETRQVCRRILLDESVVNIAVEHHGVRHVSSLGLLVDPDSRAILSWGLSSLSQGMPATAGAASGFSQNISDIRERWAVAEVLDSATLVMPELAAASMPSDPKGVIDVVIAGPRIKGVRLRRVLGAGVGPLLFRPRHDLKMVEPPTEEGWHIFDYRFAGLLVSRAVGEHNLSVRADVAKSVPSVARQPKDALDEVRRIMNDTRRRLLIAQDQPRSELGFPLLSS